MCAFTRSLAHSFATSYTNRASLIAKFSNIAISFSRFRFMLFGSVVRVVAAVFSSLARERSSLSHFLVCLCLTPFKLNWLYLRLVHSFTRINHTNNIIFISQPIFFCFFFFFECVPNFQIQCTLF